MLLSHMFLYKKKMKDKSTRDKPILAVVADMFSTMANTKRDELAEQNVQVIEAKLY